MQFFIYAAWGLQNLQLYVIIISKAVVFSLEKHGAYRSAFWTSTA